MREYSKIGPQFWNGTTGKALKKQGSEAVIVALYLMTCQHANMLGLYFVSKGYMAVDTGLGLEGACKGLQGAIEAGFCRYDEDSEVVWVIEMAAYQVGDRLDAKDNRVKGVQREYDALIDNPFLEPFHARYGEAFCMAAARGLKKPPASPSKAPPKPRARTGEGTGEGERAGESPAAGASAADAAAKRGTRLPTDWLLPKAWGEWALEKYPHWTADAVRDIALKFRNYWTAKTGKDATKLDWYATWQNWCMSDITQGEHSRGAPAVVTEPAWKREQRERMAAFGGAPLKPRTTEPETIDVAATEVR